MKILIVGGTGFIGQDLVYKLFSEGYELYILTRNKNRAAKSLDLPIHYIEYSEKEAQITLPDVDFTGVINLAGENIAAKRWTKSVRHRLEQSRVEGSKLLITALERSQSKPLQFAITASAIGYYPNNTREPCDESSPPGEGFLSHLVRKWEATWQQQTIAERLVILRIGVVLGRGGGAGEKLKKIFQWGLGGRVGDGQQPFSWIHQQDLIQIIVQAIKNDKYHGPINCVSPDVVSNQQLTYQLAKQLGRPALLPAPRSLIKLGLGEMATIAVDGQRVQAKRLQELSFKFQYPLLEGALGELYGRKPVGNNEKLVDCETFTARQYINRSVNEVFAFFSNPYNLENITPPLLQFKIEKLTSGAVREGSEIDYRLKIHGIPVKWKTLILNWQENRSFMDTQLKGPYSVWHHTHQFYPVKNGTLMVDTIHYKVPFGIIGNQFLEPFIRKDIDNIFSFRREYIKRYLEQGESDNASDEQGAQKHELKSHKKII